ncbi:MAG: hypothetical protein QM608_05665 [Caulobacter sp.]
MDTSDRIAFSRSARGYVLGAAGVVVVFLAAGWALWRIDTTVAISLFVMSVGFGALFGFVALQAVLGQGEALVIARDGVRWRGTGQRRLRFLPWERVALARVETYQIRSAVQQRLYLKLRPTGREALIAEPMIVLGDLDQPPEVVLDALRPYVFVQDAR